MRFENNELRTFCAVVEANGFRRAAELLHVTQPAVSQTIAGLERKLETVLLQRGKQLQLTAAGRRLFEHATEVLAGESSTLADIERIRRGASAQLSLAIAGTINRYYAPQLLSLYLAQWPDTQLRIAEMPARNIINAVLTGQAELGFGPLQKMMVAFVSRPLYKEARYLVVSRNHPDAEAIRNGDEQTLRDTTLITSALDDSEARPAMLRIRDNFSSVWEVSSLGLRIALIEQGRGMGYFSEKLLREEPLCHNFLRVERFSFGRIDRHVGLYYRQGHGLSDAAKRFVEVCDEFWPDN